jgi:hypothetical protein
MTRDSGALVKAACYCVAQCTVLSARLRLGVVEAARYGSPLSPSHMFEQGMTHWLRPLSSEWLA